MRIIYVTLFCSWLALLSPAKAAGGGCIACHRGIEPISQVPEMAELECTFCHRGNPETHSKDRAHEGMWANPSDYRVADETCGTCHPDILERSRKSLHATSAGIISATRYLFAAQQTKDAIFGVRPVEDRDGTVPADKGALRYLRSLPRYTPLEPEGPDNTPADDYLREECLRCHLYSYGAEQYGDYRASGCAACHVIYDDDGTYKGGDVCIVEKSKGPEPVPRPTVHRITAAVPTFQCIHCHNRGGRTGVSFIGTMEADGYGSPWGTRPREKAGRKIHGKYYNHLRPDVHHEKGLYCIDCHTEKDVHGDGNIYSKKEQAVEIECQDCHGTPEARSNLVTSAGSSMKRVFRKGDAVFLESVSGRVHRIPQVKDILAGPSSTRLSAMRIRAHMKKMECYSCHSLWAPQCYGCHAQQDTSTASFDWLDSKAANDPSITGRAGFRKATAYRWAETRSYLRWEEPSLGINSEGLVSPFIPGCQVIFTQIGPDGKCRVHNKVYKTNEGIYAIATNPIQPHTVGRKARACESCHASTKALGLGTGTYVTAANGVDLPFGLDRFVDEQGRQLQATSHEGARPFNRAEMERILRVNTCSGCHGSGRLGHRARTGQVIDNDAHLSVIHRMLTGFDAARAQSRTEREPEPR